MTLVTIQYLEWNEWQNNDRDNQRYISSICSSNVRGHWPYMTPGHVEKVSDGFKKLECEVSVSYQLWILTRAKKSWNKRWVLQLDGGTCVASCRDVSCDDDCNCLRCLIDTLARFLGFSTIRVAIWVSHHHSKKTQRQDALKLIPIPSRKLT